MNLNHNLKAGLVGLGLVGLLVATTASSCDDTTSGDQQEKDFTDRAQKQFDYAQPPHAYDASQARQNLLAAQDAMALGADSWTVQTVQGVGITFQCPSIGFPIPFGSEITNPQKVDWNSNGNLVLPQMEPYGIYPPADVPATLANCVLPSGQVGIFYSEPDLTTFMFDVRCDPKTRACEIPRWSGSKVKVTRVSQDKVKPHTVKPTETPGG